MPIVELKKIILGSANNEEKCVKEMLDRITNEILKKITGTSFAMSEVSASYIKVNKMWIKHERNRISGICDQWMWNTTE